MDKCLFSRGVFIDLKNFKAFDTVNNKILLCKLHHYGFRVINIWLLSYLKGRTQTVQIGFIYLYGKKYYV